MNAITVGCVYSVMQAFNVSAPFIIQHDWGYSPIVYGRAALIIGVALLLGALSNRILLQAFPLKKIHVYSLWGHALASLLMLSLALIGLHSLWAMLFPTFIVVYFSSFIFSNSMSLCIGQFKENVGSATSLLSFLLVMVTCFITFGMSFIQMNSQTPLAIIYIGLSLIGLVGVYLFPSPE